MTDAPAPGSATAPAQTPRVKPLAAAETAVRRFLLMIGFGFAAFVGGSMISVGLTQRIATRLEGASEPTRMFAGFFLEGAWVMLALPAIGYLASRFLELRPWSTGIIGAGTGLSFQLALQYVSTGEDGIFGEPTRQIARLFATGVGVMLTALAVKKGRALALIADEKAKVEAEKKKSQYDEFVKQSEALADRRDAVPISPAVAAAPEPAAEAPAAEPAPPEKPAGGGSTPQG